MESCIRHWDRNVGWCSDNENVKHPDRDDGDIYAQAGADIKYLLDIIKKKSL